MLRRSVCCVEGNGTQWVMKLHRQGCFYVDYNRQKLSLYKLNIVRPRLSEQPGKCVRIVKHADY